MTRNDFNTFYFNNILPQLKQDIFSYLLYPQWEDTLND